MLVREHYTGDEVQRAASVWNPPHGYITQELGGSFDHSEPGPQQSWERILDALDALLRHWPHEGRQ
jgi:hypothetical protein